MISLILITPNFLITPITQNFPIIPNFQITPIIPIIQIIQIIPNSPIIPKTKKPRRIKSSRLSNERRRLPTLPHCIAVPSA